MTAAKSSEDLVFDPRTLRLIIGALAFAFPSTVIVLTGKITTSISASYYEAGNRDVFVGFLFILGALLVAYKGHLQGEAKPETVRAWDWFWSCRWVNVYQEDIISCLGGCAAIFTALYPTACDGCAMNTQARVHMTGACILFATVVYFCLFAFLRRVNAKLLEDNPGFQPLVERFQNHWYADIPTFLVIVGQVSRDYDRNEPDQIALARLDRRDRGPRETQLARALLAVQAHKPNKFIFLWTAYEKKLARGLVYLACGTLITVTLLVFIYLSITQAEFVAHSITTFIVETIALVFFGIAWMTASQLEYLRQLQAWWHAWFKTAPATPAADAA